MLGHLEDGRLELEEVHRFVSEPVRIFDSLRWDVLGIFHELKKGLAKVGERQVPVASVSVDSWGVDYVLLREGIPQLSAPFHYRDARTDLTYERALKKAPPEIIFANTGIQFMAINTLYQLLSDQARTPELLELAQQFLTIGDYFNFLFSGVARIDESLASTTQLYNPVSRKWSEELIHLFELPRKIFPEIVPPGSPLGPLRPDLADETMLNNVQVIATCSHDTGAAVAAVPAEGHDWAFLSSGTWSLIGVELQHPLLDAAAREHNFTNEAGYGGTTRFLKNIIGMWILMECRREWLKEGGDYSFEELVRAAQTEEPLRSLINPNAARFWKPDDMPEKVRSFCEQTAQPIPQTPGQIVLCVLESLALLYRRSLEEIHAITGRDIRTLHIVGGGSRNPLLNQFAANATQRNVVAGPVEATAIGNVLVQAIALGHLDSLDALRKVVRESFAVQTFHPLASVSWQEAYERFNALDLMT
jgi:rhamnulokinase